MKQTDKTKEQRRVVKYGLTAEQLAELGGDPLAQRHFRLAEEEAAISRTNVARDLAALVDLRKRGSV